MCVDCTVEQFKNYQKTISYYFTDLLNHYEQTRSSMSTRFQTHHVTITRLVDGTGHQIQLNTITSIASQLNVSPIDILQYDRERDYERMVVNSNYIKSEYKKRAIRLLNFRTVQFFNLTWSANLSKMFTTDIQFSQLIKNCSFKHNQFSLSAFVFIIR